MTTEAPRAQMLRRRLRSMIHSPTIVELPGVYDGVSSRMTEESGFRAAFISGGSVSNSKLGKPDIGLLGWEGNVSVCGILSGVVDIPLIADADTGYGNAGTVHYTTQLFEDSGVAGFAIEDQDWPKRCGYIPGGALVPTEEMVAKITAAVRARQDPDFTIMARTDAYGMEGLDACIERARVYRAAGADVIFPDALRTPDEIRRVVAAVDGPVCVNMGLGIRRRPPTELMTALELQSLGVSMVLYPRILVTAAMAGMRRALEALSRSSQGERRDGDDQLVASFQELTDLMRLPEAIARESALAGQAPAPMTRARRRHHDHFLPTPTRRIGQHETRWEPGMEHQVHNDSDEAVETVVTQLRNSRAEQLGRLERYIRQPSVSATGEGIDDMLRMLRSDIEELGGQGKIVEGSEYPIIYGRFDEGADRTVLIHTMYDVAPADEPEWVVPPFDAKPMEWRDFGQCLVARGAEDTKSQVALVYNAIAAYRAAGVPLPVNVLLVQEASELGSGSIAEFVQNHLEELQQADVVWWPLLTARADGRPVVYLGAKGGVYGKLRCRAGSWGGPTQKDLHSMHSNWVSNPAHRLLKAIASLKSADDRQVRLPGVYGAQQPPDAQDLGMLERLAAEVDPEILLDSIGAKRLKQDSLYDALYDYCFTSELNISGLRSGEVLKDAHKCMIGPEAVASIDIRLLENQRISDVVGALERHLAEAYPEVVWETLNAYEGDRVPLGNWAVQAMLGTYASMGKTPEVWPTTAAAIATSLWTRTVGVPWLMGAPGHAEGKHGANEYIIIDTFYDACEFGVRLLDTLAAPASDGVIGTTDRIGGPQ